MQINKHIYDQVSLYLDTHFPTKTEKGVIYKKKQKILEKLSKYLMKSIPEEMEAEQLIEYIVSKMLIKNEYKVKITNSLISIYNNSASHRKEEMHVQLIYHTTQYIDEQYKKERLSMNNVMRNKLNKARTLILIDYFTSSPKRGGFGYSIAKKKLKWM